MNRKNLINTFQQEKFSIPFEVLKKKQKVKSGVLSLTNKVDMKKDLDVLRERHQELNKANLNDLVI